MHVGARGIVGGRPIEELPIALDRRRPIVAGAREIPERDEERRLLLDRVAGVELLLGVVEAAVGDEGAAALQPTRHPLRWRLLFQRRLDVVDLRGDGALLRRPRRQGDLIAAVELDRLFAPPLLGRDLRQIVEQLGLRLQQVGLREALGRFVVLAGIEAAQPLVDELPRPLPAQLSDVDTYDPFSDTWTAQASLQKGRNSLSAAALPNGAIAAGGGYVDGTGVGDNTVEYYDPVAKTWTLGSHPFSQGRSAAAMAVQNGALLIIGGERNDTVPVTSIATVELQATPGVAGTWGFLSPMNRGLELFGAVTHANDVFVTGGIDTADSSQWEPLMSISAGGQIGNGVWYDASSMLQTGRYGHAAAVGADGRIYVVGGNVSPGIVTGSAETFDVPVFRWIPMTAALRARDRLAAAVGPDGRLYAIGGSNNGVEVAFVDAYGPTIAFAPATPAAGATVTVTGASFAPNAPVRLNILGVPITTGVADGAGNLVPVTFNAPNSGSHVVQAVDDYSLYPVTRPLTVN